MTEVKVEDDSLKKPGPFCESLNNSGIANEADTNPNPGSSETPIALDEMKRVKIEILEDHAACNNGNEKIIKCPQNLEINVSREEQTYYCAVLGCRAKYASRTSLSLHYKVEHPDFPAQHNLKPYKCDECEKSFLRESALKRHKTKDHAPPQPPSLKLFPCKKCEKAYDNWKSLKSHLKLHSGKEFPCGDCNKIFKRRSSLNYHISSVHDKQRHYCQASGCGRSYSRYAGLRNHYKEEHPGFKDKLEALKSIKESGKFTFITDAGVRMVMCTLCKSRFKGEDEVKGHIERVHGSNTFPCGEKEFGKSQQNLEQYVERDQTFPEVVDADVTNCVKSENNSNDNDEYILP